MSAETVSDAILVGARRLVALSEAIATLEASKAQTADLVVVPYEYGSMGCAVARPKLLALLLEEREEVGGRLARILGTLYGTR